VWKNKEIVSQSSSLGGGHHGKVFPVPEPHNSAGKRWGGMGKTANRESKLNEDKAKNKAFGQECNEEERQKPKPEVAQKIGPEKAYPQ